MDDEMTPQDLVEKLAAIEHERWAEWQKYMHGRMKPFEDVDSYLPLEAKTMLLERPWFERWERQIATPYADLSEREKQSDRDQVLRYWPVLVEFVAQWFGDVASRHWVSVEGLEDLWREEMSGVLTGPEDQP